MILRDAELTYVLPSQVLLAQAFAPILAPVLEMNHIGRKVSEAQENRGRVWLLYACAVLI